MSRPAYIQHPGKVLEAAGPFKHVMAIALDPSSGYKRGIARCIVSREGDVEVKGYVDRSELHFVAADADRLEIGDLVPISKEIEIIDLLKQEYGGEDFIGLEDPDIWIDEKTGLTHLYFTIPIKPKVGKEKIKIHLGHAVGRDMDSLEMTLPVLVDKGMKDESSKELSVAPLNSKGLRLNLVESRDRRSDWTYSIVKVAIAEDMGRPWSYGSTAFHPADHGIPWIGGHASPGPLLPNSFLDIGPNKLLGIMNGREANKRVGEDIKYGVFSVGLFIYDYEVGEIDWVSPEPLIRDTEAKTITFASQFIETKPGEGILYAHVDDSFVRAYTLNADGIESLLP